jgi:hypothetical protein
LPKSAIWDPKELLNQFSADKSAAPIVSVSQILDPSGEQLHDLSRAIELMLETYKECAVFLNWCSLHQEPRSSKEQAAFERARKNVNLWYAHQSTFVLLEVPKGGKDQFHHGWTRFEYAMCGFLKQPHMLFDLSRLGQARDYSSFLRHCSSVRPAPCSPSQFNTELSSLFFAQEEDRTVARRKYKETFAEVLNSAEEFKFAESAWGASEVEAVAGALSWCSTLKTLSMSTTPVGDHGAKCLADALKKNTSIKALYLHDCHIGDAGASLLAQALKHNSSLRVLKLSKCHIGDAGASRLAEALRTNQTLKILNMSDCHINDDGASAFAEMLKSSNNSLEELWLGCGITDVGAARLAEACEQNSTLTTLDLRHNHISRPRLTGIETAANRCRTRDNRLVVCS